MSHDVVNTDSFPKDSVLINHARLHDSVVRRQCRWPSHGNAVPGNELVIVVVLPAYAL